MKEFKTPFAYNGENEIIDTLNAEKRVDYKCTCGKTLRLRGGKKVRDHFYHTDNLNCNNESFIHLAYKQVLLKVKKIKLPYKVGINTILNFDDVILEKKIGDFIPDAIGMIGDEKVLIEFANTSFVDTEKLEKIEAENLFCIEVYIGGLSKSLKDIEDHIINSTHNKKNLHIPGFEENSWIHEHSQRVEKKLKEFYSKEMDYSTKYYNISLHLRNNLRKWRKYSQLEDFSNILQNTALTHKEELKKIEIIGRMF